MLGKFIVLELLGFSEILLVFIHNLHYTKLKDRIRNEIGFSTATLRF